MKAIVTGAAGFIGSHLCERLLKEKWTVTGVDNFDNSYDPQVKRSNIKDCLQNKQFQLVEADIRDSRNVLRHRFDQRVGPPLRDE